MMAGAALLLALATLNPTQAQQSANHTSESTGDSASLSESQKVQQLINCVRNMKEATFIRNGSSYTCQQAADHLQAKWEKHQQEVKTATNFIDALASKSGMSGKPYQIRFADGRTVNCSEVLHQELAKMKQ